MSVFINQRIEDLFYLEDPFYLDRLQFLNNIPLENFYFVVFYNYGLAPYLYFSPSVGKDLSPEKRYSVLKCENKIFIVENKNGNKFRKRKDKNKSSPAGFLQPRKILKFGLEHGRHYPVFYSESLECWVVSL